MSAIFARLLAMAAPLGWWAALALAGLVGVLKVQAWHQETLVSLAQSKAAQAETRTAQIVAAYASAAASAAAANRAKDTQILNDQAGAANEAQRFAARAATDAAGRRSADDRLRVGFAATAARCSSGADHPAAVTAGPAASATGDLLANVQRRLAEAAGRIGDYADELRPAANKCVADYESLR